MESFRTVFAVIDALNQLQIPYLVVGSLSSSFYGIARSTKDADLVIQVHNQPVGKIGGLLGPDYSLEPQMSFETITATQRYVLKHNASKFKIELFMLSPDPHDQLRFSRRRVEQIEGHEVVLPSPEDVVITKLRWSKGGNRAKDVDDVTGVIAVQKNLDLEYIRHWCDQHGTREIFERILRSPV